MNLYCLPGLGFDHRIFTNLNWGTLTPSYIDWIEPKQNESFSNYAARMAEAIPADAQDVIIVGHSLGGMLAQEIAKQQPIKMIVLISSVRSRNEIPWFFKILKRRFTHKFFTKSFVRNTFRYWARFHDYESPQEQRLFLDMIEQQSDNYLQWAFYNLANWQTPVLPTRTHVFQIHGAKDRTFPCKLLKRPDLVIPQAGHFMVYKKTEIISNQMKNLFESI